MPRRFPRFPHQQNYKLHKKDPSTTGEMEARIATDSELIIMRGPNFVSTFLLSDYRELDIQSRYDLFGHLYLMCQFEVGVLEGCDLGFLL